MTVAPASMTPLFGRTQYRRGAVVFTLKHTLLSEGFFSLRLVVTTPVKGPDGGHRTKKQKCIIIFVLWSTLFSRQHTIVTWAQMENESNKNNLIVTLLYKEEGKHHILDVYATDRAAVFWC